MNLTEARAFLESRRGIQYGHLGTALDMLLPHVESRIVQIAADNERLTQERDAAVEAARRARQTVEDLAAAVQAALDAANPDDPAALVDFMRAIDALPAVQSARPTVGLGQIPSPRPRENS